MESDIVDQLRDYHANVLAATLCRELTRIAADEIERLREERDEARQLIFRLQTFAACGRTSPAATTRDGEAPFEPEAL